MKGLRKWKGKRGGFPGENSIWHKQIFEDISNKLCDIISFIPILTERKCDYSMGGFRLELSLEPL